MARPKRLTAETIDVAVAAIVATGKQRAGADALGVSPRTMRKWLVRGRLETDGLYRRLADAVDEMRAAPKPEPEPPRRLAVQCLKPAPAAPACKRGPEDAPEAADRAEDARSVAALDEDRFSEWMLIQALLGLSSADAGTIAYGNALRDIRASRKAVATIRAADEKRAQIAEAATDAETSATLTKAEQQVEALTEIRRLRKSAMADGSFVAAMQALRVELGIIDDIESRETDEKRKKDRESDDDSIIVDLMEAIAKMPDVMVERLYLALEGRRAEGGRPVH